MPAHLTARRDHAAKNPGETCAQCPGGRKAARPIHRVAQSRQSLKCKRARQVPCPKPIAGGPPPELSRGPYLLLITGERFEFHWSGKIRYSAKPNRPLCDKFGRQATNPAARAFQTNPLAAIRAVFRVAIRPFAVGPDPCLGSPYPVVERP